MALQREDMVAGYLTTVTDVKLRIKYADNVQTE